MIPQVNISIPPFLRRIFYHNYAKKSICIDTLLPTYVNIGPLYNAMLAGVNMLAFC